MNRRSSMGFSVSIETAELLSIVKENRDKHQAIFQEAIEKYRQQIIEYLNTIVDTVRDGKPIELYISLPCPEEHTDDYDRVIAMLSRHQSQFIEVSEETYDNYVNDNWSWTRNFLANTASYAAGAGY